MNQSIEDLLLQAANYVSGMRTEIEQLKADQELLKPQSEFDRLPDILTANQVGEYLQASGDAIRELCKISPMHGGLEGFRPFKGNDIRITKEALKNYLDMRRLNNRTNGGQS